MSGVVRPPQRRRITVLGSTGSVGQNTVDLLRRAGGAHLYDVVALTGAGNIDLLARQARDLRADLAVTALPERLAELEAALAGSGIEAAAGPEALLHAAARPADWTMSAIVGAAGLAPGLEAARHGGTLALANKESLVCAGQLLMDVCTRHGTTLIPVDSEHSAIFQCLAGSRSDEIARLILTASGGPFRGATRADMADVTPAQAMAHPNWDMGARISIDSATMFNKALEIIEAKVLFGVSPDQIEVVVHPQSIIHSMIGFTDGSILAQMGPSDMRGVIGYALNYPTRAPLPVESLDFASLATLTFEPEDRTRFPALQLAREVLHLGGLAGAVFNGAKEQALDAFIAGQIGFLDMADLVAAAVATLGPAASQVGTGTHGGERGITLDDVILYDSQARRFGREWVTTRRAGATGTDKLGRVS